MNINTLSQSVSHEGRKIKAFWIGFIVMAFLLAAVLCIYTSFHWFQSANEHDERGLARQAEAYLSAFHDFEESTDKNPDPITILKTEKHGNYFATLCQNENGHYYACVFERDSLFRNRWRATGGHSADPGEISSWNANIKGDAVLVFFGAELPDNAAWYRFKNSGVTYICPIENQTALNLFVILDTYDINGVPELLDGEQKAV